MFLFYDQCTQSKANPLTKNHIENTCDAVQHGTDNLAGVLTPVLTPVLKDSKALAALDDREDPQPKTPTVARSTVAAEVITQRSQTFDLPVFWLQ